eukprot:TRINITY_DN7647_c0_g1_i2.p1 TRINITY_DN7647_c0_g1~~TRINITY_DN7647_c0_g1_i2.p1  ORF type:complete len:487 (+),score=171.41 TRINITY_DN7647_c0_g1_i2:34-1494(+)
MSRVGKKRQRTFPADQTVSKKQKAVDDEEITSEDDDQEVDEHFVAEKRNFGLKTGSSLFGDDSNGLALGADDEQSLPRLAKETPDEKRLRLAKQYLEALGNDAQDDDLDGFISSELNRQFDEKSGTFVKRIATQLEESTLEEGASIRVMKGHFLPPTCISLSEDGRTAFSGAKDCTIIRWDVETGQKLRYKGHRVPKKKSKKLPEYASSSSAAGHTDHVLALALSSDGELMVSSGRDRRILLWDLRNNTIIHEFKNAHKAPISGLTFRKNSHEFYSCSHDRIVKAWNADHRATIDHLFGHQSEVEAIDCMLNDHPVTVGGDCTSRLWKIADQKQLVFRGQKASIDCLSIVHDEAYVSGAQDGSVALWSTQKKKPVFVTDRAHRFETPMPGWSSDTPWVSSVAVIRNTDLCFSGSCNGFLNAYRIQDTKLTRLPRVPMDGFINGIATAKGQKFIMTAVGQEHRLGRWDRIESAKNSIQIVPLNLSSY